MKLLLPFVCFVVSSAFGEIDWKPEFNDAPLDDSWVAKIDEALPESPITEPKEKRKVLLYSATNGFRHGSISIGKYAFSQMAESTGAYELIVSDDPINFEPNVLEQFDAVVLLNVTGNFFLPSTRGKKSLRNQFSDEEWAELQARDARLIGNLISYVRRGGGLVGIHSATDAYYGNWDYRNMIGGTFMGHPWRAAQEVTIEVEDSTHELVNPAFGDTKQFSFKEEIYQFNDPYSRDELRVLLRLVPELSETPKSETKREDNDYAVAWIRDEGEGRVFYSSLGHNFDIYCQPEILRHYLAGIQFATGDLEADTTPSAALQSNALASTGGACLCGAH